MDSLEVGSVPGDPALGRILVDQPTLQRRISELGAQITEDYHGRSPLLVGVLKGAFVFMSDLARAIDLPVEFDFMALTGRSVLVVEDIVDSGLTLSYLRRNLMARNPASLEVCALLVKDGMQRTDPDLAYTGFHIPADFVVGYGLDAGERYRNLPYICIYQGPLST